MFNCHLSSTAGRGLHARQPPELWPVLRERLPELLRLVHRLLARHAHLPERQVREA